MTDLVVQSFDQFKSRFFHKWSKESLAKLHKYQYTSPASTQLDDFLNRFWWTPLAEFVPPNVHPNTLTVIALFCSFAIAYWPQQMLSPNSDRELPRLIYLLSALGYFAYQTLDAMDGKQARKTKLSSPLGQMMDHGCDALTTYYSCFLIASAFQIPLTNGVAIALLITAITCQLVYYGWYELRHGVYKTNTGGIGVTEGQYAIIILNLVSFFAPSLWQSTLGGLLASEGTFIYRILNFLTFGLQFKHLAFWPCLGAMIAINVYEAMSFMKILRSERTVITNPANEWKRNITLASAEHDMMALGFHMYTQAALCLSQVLARHPLPISTAICFFGAQIVWRIMIASLLDEQPVLYDLANLPYYMISVFLATNVIEHTWLEGIICWALGAYAIVESLGYAWNHFEQMKDFLEVPLFVVPLENQRIAAASQSTPASQPEPARPATSAGQPDPAPAAAAAAAAVAPPAASATTPASPPPVSPSPPKVASGGSVEADGSSSKLRETEESTTLRETKTVTGGASISQTPSES